MKKKSRLNKRKDRTSQERRTAAPSPQSGNLSVWLVAVGVLAVIGVIVGMSWNRAGQADSTSQTIPASGPVSEPFSHPPAEPSNEADEEFDAAQLLVGPRDDVGGSSGGPVSTGQQQRFRVVWNGLDEAQRTAGVLGAMVSNIRQEDYAGPESCRECHAENFEHWSVHPHRWMNADATDATVLGDFSDPDPMHYLGGLVHFRHENGVRSMRLERGGDSRTYRVTRTIGSRFTQYYVGLLDEGPDAPDHPARGVEHVLPIGWWIDRREWVPVVHIDDEGPDGTRWDPFATVSTVGYDSSCSACHTTPTMGDWMLNPAGMLRFGFHSHVPVTFDAREYLREAHPGLAARIFSGPRTTREQRMDAVVQMRDQDARQHAVSLGISCEGCHLGSREHVRASDQHKSAVLPHFFPVSSNVVALAARPLEVHSRRTETVNFICARCHSGNRPQYAGGMSTWNSVEFSDAEKGYCYVRKTRSRPDLELLSCTGCHDPHEPTGPRWRRAPDEDDASCLQCHKEYEPAADRFRHTRHLAGSAGDRCLNCHMPRLNEGMQDVVRTHTISNPSWPSMIEANHPNACNLCHLDQPIDWTLTWLGRWYRIDRYRSFDDRKLAENYPDRAGPVGLGWLKSPHEPTRLVAMDALARQKAHWALPSMVEALDDDYLLNRQFARIALEQWLGVRLEDHGYRFYMTREERREPLAQIRAALLAQPR